MALNIKKGQKANLPSTKAEDTLYICEEGNLFYDFSSSKRIELGKSDNNDNINLFNSEKTRFNGCNNIGYNTNFTNGGSIRMTTDQLPIDTIYIKPTHYGPSGSTEYYDYTNSNVLTVSYYDQYRPSEQEPEDWTTLIAKFNALAINSDYNSIPTAHERNLTPNDLYPITLTINGINYSLFNIIYKELQNYSNSYAGQTANTVLTYSFSLSPLSPTPYSGATLLNMINTQFPDVFTSTTETQAYNNDTQIITQLTLKENNTAFITFGSQVNGGNNSIVNGEKNSNFGEYSLLNGVGLRNARSYATILGKYNNFDSSYLFSIGNGTNTNNRKNIFGITTTGRVNTTGTFATGGADYAEYFEWKEIPNIEDTRGLFVTLDKNKIRLANKNDKYILGIVSANPGVIGNEQAEEWQGKYEIDIFGCKKLDAKGNEILSSAYDKNQKYISREKRAEWAIVGLLGQIIMVDDGTCQEGEFCFAGENGIATAAEQGYYVMERLDDNHIKVCFK